MNRRWNRPALLFFALLSSFLVALVFSSTSPLRADNRHSYTSKGPVLRQYTLEDRIRYQLWDYKWDPNPNEPITRIRISLSQQKVYVYQGDDIAGESPVTTGKPGHETPTGHYSILVKDIDHKSNLYGVFLDANGNVVDGNAEAGMKPPPNTVYDSADMPYYMRLRDDGVGMHGGYIPGTGPASHGCIRLPHAFAELLYSNVSVGTPVDIVP